MHRNGRYYGERLGNHEWRQGDYESGIVALQMDYWHYIGPYPASGR